MTPRQVYEQRSANFTSTLFAPMNVSKSQLLRVLELYAVMMIILVISWIIYSIFKSKDTSANTRDPYAELAQQTL